MDRRQARELDHYITGNYGEDQFPIIQGVCKECGAGTLNNDTNLVFELEDDGQLTCMKCHSRHIDLI